MYGCVRACVGVSVPVWVSVHVCECVCGSVGVCGGAECKDRSSHERSLSLRHCQTGSAAAREA